MRIFYKRTNDVSSSIHLRQNHLLNGEIEVLVQRLKEMETTSAKLKQSVKDSYRKKDVAGAKAVFVQLSNVKKQIMSLFRRHQCPVCETIHTRMPPASR